MNLKNKQCALKILKSIKLQTRLKELLVYLNYIYIYIYIYKVDFRFGVQ